MTVAALRPSQSPPTRDEPLDLRPRPPRPLPLRFHKGTHPPYGVRWFGSTALFGHLRHLVASLVASESVDTRDWMRPEQPTKLLRSVSRVLRGADDATSLAEALGRPVWIDFVADTGDDRDVSSAVARMLFRSYRIDEEGAPRILPRGDLLVFGGDTAYPVSTADELHRRLTEPWNEVLRETFDDGRRRVLLGVPGNHDWYDGLDGFARLFRRSAEPVRDVDEGSPHRRARKSRSKTGIMARQLHLDEVRASLGLLGRLLLGIRAFFKGEGLRRRKRLALRGYDAVQESSYFAFPLAPGIDVWGVDRQLRTVDFRQRSFFARRRQQKPDARVLFLASDPASAFGERNEPGAKALASCNLRFERDPVLYLTGDMHHYERRTFGPSTHVIAGGGGAFLHGTRINPGPGGEPACAYPDGPTSRGIVFHVPLRMMLGEAGFIPHGTFAFLAFAQLVAHERGTAAELGTAVVLSALFIVGFYFNAAHHRQHPWLVTGVAVPFGAFMGAMPALLEQVLPAFLSQVLPNLATSTALIATYAFLGAFVFGLFLTTCAILGIEHQQAFAVLGHPGFKHFVRLCVHPDGTVEAFTIGKDDPLAPGTEAELVDRFTW